MGCGADGVKEKRSNLPSPDDLPENGQVERDS
jgi:hypothetical protein